MDTLYNHAIFLENPKKSNKNWVSQNEIDYNSCSDTSMEVKLSAFTEIMTNRPTG